MKKSKKIIICAALALIVAGGVFAVLALRNKTDAEQQTEQSIDYKTTQKDVAEIAEQREAVSKFLNTEVKAAKVSDEEQKTIESFEKAADKSGIVERLRDAKAYGDEKVKTLVDEAIEQYQNIKKLREAEKDAGVMLDGELSADDLKKLGESANGYLKKLGTELKEYRESVKKLAAKDGSFEKKYKELVTKGEEIKKKYANVKMEDLVGKTKAEILAFYDKIDELNKYLSERE